jgi:hypothetical protein
VGLLVLASPPILSICPVIPHDVVASDWSDIVAWIGTTISLAGLADAVVRIRVLEESLTKANKVIDKSKKVQEVQHLVKQNSFLQEKLAFQEQPPLKRFPS